MAGTIDYARLREQTMGSGLDEEAVTVNTRALIDKVLARYSGEWTTLRELIQNAADASASKVTIRFETIPSATVPVPQTDDAGAQLRHVLLHHTLKRLLVSNNGEAFGENDWSRLKRIAEGNPDETKIGAFGVGFYSVFADCETPFVTSGDQTMAFYWKGNSLFTRKGRIPNENSGSDTCFMLDYRNTTSPIPGLISLCQFLSTSLTFVGLTCIELWLDQWNVLRLTKTSEPSENVSIPSDINPKTKDGLMKIVGVDYQNAHIDAKWMNIVGWNKTTVAQTSSQNAQDTGPPVQSLRSFFSRFTSTASTTTATSKQAAKMEDAIQKALSEDLAGSSTATVSLRISTVNVQTYVGKQLSAELERATKKPPPKHTRIAILTSNEASSSMKTVSGLSSGKAAEIFASVLPVKNGRIFIGFPTAQTTGLLAHISAPSVIPTVERESIDLNARYVRSWNIEMLRVAGIACRVAYTGDMIELKSKLARQQASSGNKKVQHEDLAAVMPSAIHTFKQYTYQESTPSSQVGQIIEEAFWTCNQKASIDILSTRGVLPSLQVRLATEDLSFVEGIPVVPDMIAEKASDFLKKLQEFGLLSEITTRDIKKELEAQSLDEKQLIELLKWASKKLETQQLDSSAIQALFDGTVATIAEENTSTYPGPVLLLGSIDTFSTVGKIPAELPMPPSTIPFRFVKNIPRAQLESFGWNELQIVPWLRYIIEKDGSGLSADQSLTKSATFAAQVLPVLSKAWDPLSQSSKTTVSELLANRTVIPTKLGMRKPSQAYFASVRLFDDLPTVHGLQGVKEKFLSSLGVRKTVELAIVFDRLMAKSGEKEGAETKWSHKDLIKYLVSVREDIPVADTERLRKTPICPAEQPGGGKSVQLYRVSDLFEPKNPLRDLGLPLLHWPEAFKLGSPEAKFLSFLGLKPYPTVPELVNIMSKAASVGDAKLYATALLYMVENHYANQYRRYPFDAIDSPFLPLQGHDLSKLATPKQCFVNSRCAVLDFDILREDLHPHAANLGVEPDPPIVLCCERLIKRPPLTRNDAKIVFAYFSGRLNEIGPSGNLAERLGEAPIVPITRSTGKTEKDANVRFVSPRACFLGDTQTYGDIFDFVDFGSEANAFLLKVGSKHEPSATELAGMVVKEPSRLLNTLGSEKYLSLLRRLADNTAGLKNDKALWANLKRSPCLLAEREVSSNDLDIKAVPDEDGVGFEEEEQIAIRESTLCSAGDMVINDEYLSFSIFRYKLLVAPSETLLENFYASLGTPWLSSIVEENSSMGSLLKDQSSAQKLQKLIIERSRVFLHEHTADAIRHDARWLEKTLKVEVTEFLSNRKTLRGYNLTHTAKRSAALHRETRKDAKLYVTVRPDLYEVSRALMVLLLKRPKQQDYIALEMIMESDLRRLKTRGYNVDRILRQQAAESRIAETERQRLLEDEQNRIFEQERAWKAAQEAQSGPKAIEGAPTPDRPKPMPGTFNDSPDHGAGPSNIPSKPKKGNFFSNLGRQLGLHADDEEQRQQLQRMLDSAPGQRAIENASDTPPPYSPNDTKPPSKPTGAAPEHVTPPHKLQQNLVSAIQSSRAHDSTTIFSPPSTNLVKEQASYCDSKSGQDLSFVADLKAGIKVFLPNSMPAEKRTEFLQANLTAINAFAFLLLDCGSIFLLKPQSLHIYYNETGNSIAFNTNGSLFCNLRFFQQLHWARWNLADGEGKKEAAVYWWVTLCHELAHNLVSAHSSEHGYYTESFVTQYYPKMVLKAAQYGNEGPPAAA